MSVESQPATSGAATPSVYSRTIDSIIGELRASDSENSDIQDDQMVGLEEDALGLEGREPNSSSRDAAPTWSQEHAGIGPGATRELTEMDSISSEAAQAYLHGLEREHERELSVGGGPRKNAAHTESEQAFGSDKAKSGRGVPVEEQGKVGTSDEDSYHDPELSQAEDPSSYASFREHQFGRGAGLSDPDAAAKEEFLVKAAGALTALERKVEREELLERRVRFESGICASGGLCLTHKYGFD